MASDNTFSTANGIFKNSYAALPTDLTPEFTYYAKECKDVPASEKTGGDYYKPVILTAEASFTLDGSNSNVFALNPPEALVTTQAHLAGSQYVGRAAMSYEVIKRSETNKNSYMEITRLIVKSMLKTSYNIQELMMLWGANSKGIGTVASVGGTGNATVTITTAEWASGIWWGSEKRECGFYTAAGLFVTSAKVVSYSLTARTVTFDKDLTAAGVLAAHVIYVSAKGSAAEHVGIMTAATTSGTLWGIDNTNYNMWTPGAAANVAGALDFGVVLKNFTLMSERGLGEEIPESDIIVNKRGWNNINVDIAGLRRTDSSYKEAKFENGHETLEFFSDTGIVRVISHKYMKEGNAIIHPRASKSIVKVGAQSVPSFALPGMTKDGMDYIMPLANSAGAEVRLYWDMATFSEYISQFGVLTGIVNK